MAHYLGFWKTPQFWHGRVLPVLSCAVGNIASPADAKQAHKLWKVLSSEVNWTTRLYRLYPLDVLIPCVLQVTNAVGAEELPAEPEKVLLTGANGFLGRFLLLDFLKRVSTK